MTFENEQKFKDINIDTPRLQLVSIVPATLHSLFTQKTEEEFRAFMGCDEAGYAHYRQMVENGMETFRITFHLFLIVRKEDNQPIGECGFHAWNRVHCRTELFYLLRKDEYKRRGYMKEALEHILDFGFAELKLHRIEALITHQNIPSHKLLQHFGFKHEGTKREDYLVDGQFEDSECYSLLEHEWASRNKKL